VADKGPAAVSKLGPLLAADNLPIGGWQNRHTATMRDEPKSLSVQAADSAHVLLFV
jgi:hypothetical protein